MRLHNLQRCLIIIMIMVIIINNHLRVLYNCIMQDSTRFKMKYAFTLEEGSQNFLAWKRNIFINI